MKNLKRPQALKINHAGKNTKSMIFFAVVLLLISCATDKNQESLSSSSELDSKIIERNKFFDANRLSDQEFNSLFKSAPKSPYSIEILENGFGVGTEDFRIGRKIYRHIITVGLNCGAEETFVSSTYVNFKNIQWELNPSLKGNATTDVDGFFKIFLNTDNEQPFKELSVQVKKKKYVLALPAYKKVKIEIDECFAK